MRRFLIVAVFLAMVSLYMLTIATGNSNKPPIRMPTGARIYQK